MSAFYGGIYTNASDEIVPIVISTAKKQWRLPQRFRSTSDNICGEVTLNFGYLLLDLAALPREVLQAEFPQSYPYLLAWQSLQQLNKEAIEAFFVGSLALRKEERLRLMGQVTNCLTESSGNFSMNVLERIEAGCIKKIKDRLMRTVKIGQEGWLEQGFKRGLAEGKAKGKAEGKAEGKAKGKAEERYEIALRMLKEGELEAKIRRITGITKKEIESLQRGLKTK